MVKEEFQGRLHFFLIRISDWIAVLYMEIGFFFFYKEVSQAKAGYQRRIVSLLSNMSTVCTSAYRHTCSKAVCRSRVNTGVLCSHPLSALYLIFWDTVSHCNWNSSPGETHWPVSPQDPPVSTSQHWDSKQVPHLTFTWVLAIWTQVLTLVQKALYTRSHLLSPWF